MVTFLKNYLTLLLLFSTALSLQVAKGEPQREQEDFSEILSILPNLQEQIVLPLLEINNTDPLEINLNLQMDQKFKLNPGAPSKLTVYLPGQSAGTVAESRKFPINSLQSTIKIEPDDLQAIGALKKEEDKEEKKVGKKDDQKEGQPLFFSATLFYCSEGKEAKDKLCYINSYLWKQPLARNHSSTNKINLEVRI